MLACSLVLYLFCSAIFLKICRPPPRLILNTDQLVLTIFGGRSFSKVFKVFKGNIIVVAVSRKLRTGKQGSLTSRKDNGPMAQLCWRKNGRRFHKRKKLKRLKREAPGRE